jgi:flagellar hook assembly protein FlgD
VIPNPARGPVRFGLASTTAGNIVVTIADLSGRIVRAIPITVSAGDNLVDWDGRDDSGHKVPAGTYLFQSQGTVGRVEVVE